MALGGDIGECCKFIESGKLNERKKYCDKLSSLLDCPQVLDTINKGDYVSWKSILTAIQSCLKKDAEKIMEDVKKKGSRNVKYPSSDLYRQLMKLAVSNASDLDSVDITLQLGYIIGCMKDHNMRSCYDTVYTKVMLESILSLPQCRCKIKGDNWTALLEFEKDLLEEKPNDIDVYQCLMLTIKYGPLSGLRSSLLRDQFSYVKHLCKGISSRSARPLQEFVLDIANDLCKHTAKDNRVSCCKFGEDVFSNILDLYEQNGREAKIKEQIIEFFLLQLTIHQPDGVLETHPCAYARNWNTWKRCLKMLYSVLYQELQFFFLSHYKNHSFFKVRGEATTLSSEFSTLFVDVSFQIFNNTDMNITFSMDCTLSSGVPSKRQKLDISLESYIGYIQETKSWVWIHIVCELIKRYPNILKLEEYISLLQILSAIQIESNDYNTLSNVYSCLLSMFDIQEKFEGLPLEIERIWKIVAESTTRAFGLNQQKEEAEILLEHFIKKQIVDPKCILQSYSSGVLNITVQSINIFETTLYINDFSRSDQSRMDLIACILNPQNIKEYNYLLERQTALLLVNLTVKHWQTTLCQDRNVEKSIDRYSDIKRIYRQTLFEESVVHIDSHSFVKSEKNYSFEAEVVDCLQKTLMEFVTTLPENIEVLLSVAVLVTNMVSCFVDYNYLETDLRDSVLLKLVERILTSCASLNLIEMAKEERKIKKLLEILRTLNCLFSLDANASVMGAVKHFVPFQLLKSVISILNELQDEQLKQSDIKFDLRKLTLETLSNFCVSKGSLNLHQKNILDVISEPNYSCESDGDYILLLTFLKTLKFAKPGVIPDDVLSKILKSVEEICLHRYECSSDAIEILKILHDLYPHLALSKNDDDQITSVQLLQPFYNLHLDYGPMVAVAFLDCVIQLCQVDPEAKFSHWSSIEVITVVPDFLHNEYQEVRFKAIETLVKFYKFNAHCKMLLNFHKQEMIFSKMYNMSLEVFAVAGDLSEERQLDELTSRTASVLHTFADMVIHCSTWTLECLFTLLKLANKKKLGSLDKVLMILNKYMLNRSDKNILEKYIEYLIERWLLEGFSFDNFEFALFNCKSKAEFYVKYFENCVPFFMGTDRINLMLAAKRLGYTEKDVVEKTCAKIFGLTICKNTDNLNGNILRNDKILAYYANIIGTQELKQLLLDNVEGILSVIFESMTDDRYILEKLGTNVIFLTKKLSFVQVEKCISFVQETLCNGMDLSIHLAEQQMSKLEKVLLFLKTNIYNALTEEDKIKALHRYVYFVNMITKSLSVVSICREFFIRDTTYSIINVVTNHIDFIEFSLAACKFLEAWFKDILPKFSDTFEMFLNFVVNSLKNFAINHSSVRNISMAILNFLIVDNVLHLSDGIQKLHSFPKHADFYKIRTVHHNIKYGQREASLEAEINYFLESDDLSTRMDSLAHLKNVLSDKKEELGVMYEKLQEIRGFSEECKTSIIHRLICSLAKLSCSTDEKVSFEAAKCLGELGPANLMTLVLEPEQCHSEMDHVPFELLTGQVVSLLSDYIVDGDIRVVEAASKSFNSILSSKEGKTIGGSCSDFGFGVIEKKYILPYFSQGNAVASTVSVDMEALRHKVDDEELWCPTSDVTHTFWITTLVSRLLETFIDKSYLQKLIPICEVKPNFAEHLLPLLINVLLFKSPTEVVNVLSRNINQFFSLHWEYTVPVSKETKSVTVNKNSVKCMLEVVRLVRLQKDFNTSKSSSVAELRVDYLKAAKAAEFCAAHFTALMYSELWCQNKIEDLQNMDKSYCEQRSTMVDIIYENEREEVGIALQNILRTAYKAVGDLDALPGCGISFLLKPEFRAEHYKELGRWDQVMHFYAIQASHNPVSISNLMESLKKCCLHGVSLFCSAQLQETPYECLWRLGQWNVEEKRKVSIDEVKVDAFEKYRFYALKSMHDNNQYLFEDFKTMEIKCIIEDLRHTSLESSQNLYPILTNLQSLVEMEEFAHHTSQNVLNIFNKWKLQMDIISKNDFWYVEPIIAQRITMLCDYLKKNEDDRLKEYLVDMTLDFACLAKDEGFFKEGLTYLEHLKQMTNLSEDISVRIQLMDAQLSWLVNNTLIARHILSKLCKNRTANPKLRATALKLSGQYMSETYSENRFTIIHNYFLESLTIMREVDRNSNDCLNILDTYDKLAQFADREYQQIMTYMKSDMFQKKIMNMERAKQATSNIRKLNTDDERRAYTIQNRQSNIDEIEIDATRKDYNQLLNTALKFYLLNLHHSKSNNIRIFRIMSLFLENRNNSEIAPTIEKHLVDIPSYKYIMMLPQLVPHIADTNKDLFSQKVYEIVNKCAVEHPHHTLPLLLALANANKDREFNDAKTKTSSNDARIITANKLLAKLKKNDGLCNHINKLQNLSLALIDLAYYQFPDERKKEYTIPKTQKIRKIQDLEDILLPTVDLEVRIDKDYSNIVGIASFDQVFNPVGGINAPKRIKCRGTDGITRSQLVKGSDDLRQDAVMQQVFTIMNSLLSKNKQTRNLLIRTYKIVPLSMRSGILQWVDNSMPIGMYLVGEDGSSGAHSLYRPKDRTPNNCRTTFKRCAGKSAEEKRKVYGEICQNFKPVLHKFFENSFPQPTIWYERRRAYIYSIATSSMCGYILGIGDRHVSNILIDKTTAEVIHIDFGIAFEQGKVLPTPETVPFRLTRDIVDGMGVSGVEGLFRRSCEKTMEVLRQNAQTIITILEVLLYDPLYAWTVTAAEANKRQTDDDIQPALTENSEEERSVNMTAERALLRLREKLQGTELGHPTSIEHQVGTLIQQAIDPANLCKLYYGWQPYL